MKKLMALMCAVMFLSLVVTEAQAQRRRGGGDDDWRGRRGNGNARRDRGNGGRDRGNVGRDRDDRGRRDVGRDRRRPDDRDYRNPRRDNRRPDDRDYRTPRRDTRDPGYRRDRHSRHQHRPNWNRPGRRFTRHTHRPDSRRLNHRRRFSRRYDYHRTIPYRYVYWDTWIRFRVSFNDGYVIVNDYPYYVYNGYRHRYSSYDTCDYDLVDGYSNSVQQRFYGYTCAQAYDLCADLRDDLNYRRTGYQYFCSERLDLSSGSYSHWNSNDDFYYDVY